MDIPQLFNLIPFCYLSFIGLTCLSVKKNSASRTPLCAFLKDSIFEYDRLIYSLINLVVT